MCMFREEGVEWLDLRERKERGDPQECLARDYRGKLDLQVL